MLKNTSCTIYSQKNFSRIVIEHGYWFDARGASLSRNGMQITDSVLVYLYNSSYLPQAGDLIVKGVTDFAFNTESQKTISESMQAFRAAHPEFAVVKSVNDCRFGGLPHIEVIAR